MTCPNLGTLRAFSDGELPEDQRHEVQRHLAGCKACQQDLKRLGETSSWVTTRLVALEPVVVPPPDASLRRLRQSLAMEEKPSGLGRFAIVKRLQSAFGLQRYRISAAALALVLALSMALAYPPVWSAAESFLTVFRVQKFEAVSVDPARLPDVPAPTDIGDLTFTREPKIRTDVTLDEARKLVDFGLRIPAQIPTALRPVPSLAVSGECEATFTVDLEKLNAYLTSIGATNVNLPAELDGATMRAKIPPLVGLVYSDRALADLKDADPPSSLSDARILFVAQGRSPIVEAPSNVNLDQVRDQLLQVPGLPPDLVARLRGVDDWTQTLLVPVIGGVSTNVKVDGVDGLLITYAEHGMSVAIWQKNDVLYAVGGNLAQSELLGVANSLK